MPVFNVTSADAGTVLVNTAGSLTEVEVPASRGVSGRFSLTDPALNAARGFWQPIIAIGVDNPVPGGAGQRQPELDRRPAFEPDRRAGRVRHAEIG
jgi:hypothetical protein